MAPFPPERRGALRWLARAPDAVAAGTLLALTLITCVDVFGRYVFNAPVKGADELMVLFMAISAYAVFATVTWREDNVCVDLIDLMFPKRAIALRQAMLNLVAAAFMALATWRVWELAERLTGDGEVTEYLRIERGPPTYFFAIMCGATVLALIGNAVRYAIGRGPLQQPPGPPAGGG